MYVKVVLYGVNGEVTVEGTTGAAVYEEARTAFKALGLQHDPRFNPMPVYQEKPGVVETENVA